MWAFSNGREMFVWECAKKKFRNHCCVIQGFRKQRDLYNNNQIHWDVKYRFHRGGRFILVC